MRVILCIHNITLKKKLPVNVLCLFISRKKSNDSPSADVDLVHYAAL